MISRHRLLIVTLALIVGCSPPEDWTGIVYPNGNNLRDSVSLGSFPSRLECAAAAIDVLDRMGLVAQGDYECGLRCKRDKKLPALFVCETTEKPIDPKLLSPGMSALQSLHKECMARVATLHSPAFLTYPLQLNVWLGGGDSNERRTYAAFAEAVECLSATSKDVVPLLSMDPIEFSVYFDQHAQSLRLPYRLSR